MKVSVIIPVFNSVETLKITLQSVLNNTDHLYELVLVDDNSAQETQDFINALQLDPILGVRLTKTRNPEHSWTNASWNMGVRLATGDYLAILNSDITVSPHWDTELIRMLDKKQCSIACPMEKRGDKLIALDPVIAQFHPGMIKGACFMFRRQETKKFFPIPPELKHWCGDNYLADRAAESKGVAFCASAIITHAITQSGKFIERGLYNRTCYWDVVNYQKMSGRDMTEVIRQIMPSALQPDMSFHVDS